MKYLYLDHNSTTPLAPEVAQAMAECDAQGYANPASQHAAGRRARQALEDARDAIGCMLGADMSGHRPDRVIFTSGGTEANNLAILGLADASLQKGAPHPSEIVVSAIEHPSVLGPAEWLEHNGWVINRLPVDKNGVAEIAALDTFIRPTTRLVSLMLGNNETGALQPVSELSARCARRGVPLHTDAVQVVGKLPVNFRELRVSALTVAAHKFHGPRGVGALLLRHDVSIAPVLFGGFQQAGLRPGTESLTLAVGMKTALELATREQSARYARMRTLRDRFEAALKAGYPRLVVQAEHAQRLPHTSNLAFVGLERQALLMALDMTGIACSTGSACASGSSEPSPVLLAMNCPAEVVTSSLRFSLGADSTESEIDDAVARILAVCANLCRTNSR